MADQAVSLAGELSLRGSVFFNRAWVPYEERLEWFAEADLGVSAHRDSLEARLAFRTRLLDHIASGTPLVVTQGDVSRSRPVERVASSLQATSTVDVGALAELLTTTVPRGQRGKAVVAAQEELSWSRIVELPAAIERSLASPPAALVGTRCPASRR